MGMSRAHLGFAQRKSRFPKKETLHHIYSRHVNTEIPVADIVRDEFPQFEQDTPDMVRTFADYTARKSERNLVDYDDLLLLWAMMLEQAPELGAKIASLYDHVLVDEYQDTNVLQARILRGMAATHRNVTVVGDDAQSIYSFRGATIRNMLEFPEQFPGATIVTLEQNYRSTQPVLDVSNTLIARTKQRYGKRLFTTRTGGERPLLVAARDEHEQTQYVVDKILELHEAGTALHEMAVLFRAGYMSADLEIELTNRQIPFEKWGGIKFLEAAHVKDVLAFLRILENPRDEVSWFRVLTLLPGIGEITARAALDMMADRSWDPAAFAAWTPPPRARAAHAALSTLLTELMRPDAAGAQRTVSEEIAALRVLYDDILRDRYDRAEPRLADLGQLEVIAGGFPHRAAFLSELALEPPSATQDYSSSGDSEQDALILSTAHSAKGREWDAVFIIWAVDGWFPSGRSLASDEDIEEERRLMYVAMTRARKHLTVSYPLNAYQSRYGTEYSVDQLTRFIDPGVRELMTRVAAMPETLPSAAPSPFTGEPVDLRALLRGRFGAG
jgi:DNA helicase-2/ATP-dependent DNA helicase PcrA